MMRNNHWLHQLAERVSRALFRRPPFRRPPFRRRRRSRSLLPQSHIALASETLEPRQMLFGTSIEWDDPGGTFTDSQREQIEAHVEMAAHYWSGHLDPEDGLGPNGAGVTLEVKLAPNHNFGALASANSVDTEVLFGFTYEGATYEIATGNDPNGTGDGNHDVEINVGYQGFDWFFEPDLENRTDPLLIPANQFDFMSTILHEWGHALGFNGGWRAVDVLDEFGEPGQDGELDSYEYNTVFDTDRYPNGPGSGAYDSWLVVDDGFGFAALPADPEPVGTGWYFAGPKAVEEYGAPFVPLMSTGPNPGNPDAAGKYGSAIYHVGNPVGSEYLGQELSHKGSDPDPGDLMYWAGDKGPPSVYISDLDLAILEDLGGYQRDFFQEVSHIGIADRTFTSQDEHPTVGTEFGRFVANDPDDGDDGHALSYAITAGNPDTDGDGNLAFGIDPTGPRIVVKDQQDVDYENAQLAGDGRRYLGLEITASDGSGESAAAHYYFYLEDIDETPVFNDQVFSVDENSPDGTHIGTFTGVSPAGFPLTYTIVSSTGLDNIDGDANAPYTIVGNRLIVNDSHDFNYEILSTMVIIVRASDGTLSDTAEITINIRDVDDDDWLFTIPENSAEGTFVGWLDATADTYFFTELVSPDGDGNPAFRLVKSDRNDITYVFVNDSGDLDYENSGPYHIIFNPYQTSSGSLREGSKIYVKLIDAHVPIFSGLQLDIPENSVDGTLVYVFDNPAYTYTITGGNPDLDTDTKPAFEIYKSPRNNVSYLVVYDADEFDYESNPAIDLIVQAVYDADPDLPTVALVEVDVTNVDEAPQSNASILGQQVMNEDGELLFGAGSGNSIVVTDPDGHGYAVISLSVGDGTLTFPLLSGLTILAGSNGSEAITLSGSIADVNTALDGLKYTPTPDYSGAESFVVTTGSDFYGSDIDTVGITVNPINDAPTALALANRTSSLSEDADTTTALKVADLQITDDGVGSNTVSLTGADAASFEVIGTELYLKAGTALDFATKDSFAVTVNVEDSSVAGSTPVTVDLALAIAPVVVTLFTYDTSANQLVGGALEGSGVSNNSWGHVAAISGWTSSNGVEVWGEGFANYATSGRAGTGIRGQLVELDYYGSGALDWIEQGVATSAGAEYLVLVDVLSRTGSGVSDDMELSWNGTVFDTAHTSELAGQSWQSYGGLVTGSGGTDALRLAETAASNDGYGPVIDNARVYQATSPTVDEGLPGETVVTNIHVSTVDGVAYTNLRLSHDAGGLFTLDADTGVIRTTRSLDFDSDPSSYQLTVAIDTAEGTLTKTLNVGLNETNQAPTAVTLTNVVSSLADDTDTSSRIKLADLQITDDALGTNDVTLSGSDAASFEVIGSELYLKAGTGLDYDLQTSYSVTVNVEDSSVSGSTPVTTSLTLSITEGNQPPTGVALANTVTSLAEDTDTISAIKVADIQITDDALGTNEITLTGSDAASFEVIGSELFLAAGTSLDYESQASYSVTVNVEDSSVSGSTPVTAAYTLGLGDVNEAPTGVALANAVTTLAENTDTSNRVKVADIQITDDALGSNAVSLTGSDAASFEVVGTELFLVAGTALDYETQSSYAITVNVEDSSVSGSTPVTAAYTLGLGDVNEAPTGVALANAVTTLAEDTDTSSRVKVADLQITDDALGTNAITLSGSDAASFEVIGSELFLAAGTSLDYETQASYSVTVNAGDSSVAGSTPVTAAYTLGLGDVNEAPTGVVLANAVTTLAENADTSSRVKVADLQITDDAIGTNDVTLTGSDAASFEVIGSELFLKAGTVLDFALQTSYSVTVNVEDSSVAGSTPVTASLTLSITELNLPPTNVAVTITNPVVAEDTDTSVPIEVGDIVILDDGVGVNTITLSGPDAASFEVVGLKMYHRAGFPFDYETQIDYFVTVNVADAALPGSTPVEASVLLSLTDVNEAPTGVALANTVTSLAEDTDTISAIKLADIQISDDALGTNTIDLSGADAASFEVVGTELYLKAGTGLDFTLQTSYSVTVNVEDSSVAGSTPVTVGYTLAITNVNELPSGTVAISGTATEDETLTASNNLTDGDGLGAISYQWRRDGGDIGGATNSTYTLTQADVGAQITVTASYTDGGGTAESVTSDPTSAVADINDAPTGVVLANTVSSLPEDTDTTSAVKLADIVIADDGHAGSNNAITLSGSDAASFEVIGSELFLIAGTSLDYETQTSYSVTVNVEDSTVSGSTPVTVGYTLGITNVNELPSGTVVISGTATEDETLTASNNLTDGDGLGAISYQWRRDGGDIGGATNSTYTLTQADVGAQITVTASYTDGGGTAESVTSDPTSAVADVNDAPTGVVLANTVSSLPEDTDTTSAVKLADIVIADDGHAGSNNAITLSGSDAASFEVVGTELNLKAGTGLDFTLQTSYSVTVNVEDSSVAGSTPVTAELVLEITSSGSANLTLFTYDTSANQLVNGTFEGSGVSNNSWGHVAAISGWTSSNGVEVWGEGFANYATSGRAGTGIRGQLVELDYYGSGALDWIEQGVASSAGAEYLVLVDVLSRTGWGVSDDMELSWNGTVFDTAHTSELAGQSWQSYGGLVTGSGGTDALRLAETAASNDGYGPVIDNARVYQATSPTVDEGLPGETVVTNIHLSTVDGVAYTNLRLSNDAGGLFTLDADTGVIRTTRSLDFDSDPSSYQLTVAVDTAGGTLTKNLNVGLNDITTAPRGSAYRAMQQASQEQGFSRASLEATPAGRSLEIASALDYATHVSDTGTLSTAGSTVALSTVTGSTVALSSPGTADLAFGSDDLEDIFSALEDDWQQAFGGEGENPFTGF